MMLHFRFISILTFLMFIISLFGTEANAQNDNTRHGFSTALAECGTQYNVKISRSISDRAEEAVIGGSRLDLESFLNIFPENDRLKAYSIFQECLARRYQFDRGSGSIDLNQRVASIATDFPDITNKIFDVSGSVSSVGNPEKKFPFSISRVCEIFVTSGPDTGFKYSWIIEDEMMNYVDGSFMGSNPRMKRLTMDIGHYFFILKANTRGNYNAFHDGRIEARCK